MEEENNIEIKKANIILGYISLEINIIIILVSLYLFNLKQKFIKKLLFKFFTLIILDSISFIIYENISKNFKYIILQIIGDLLFSCFSTIEFYLFLSFIYQIYNHTKISILSKKITIIAPLQLSFIFLFVTFSYHNYSKFYKIINFLENVIILCCITLLYRYLKNITKTIKNNLLPRDLLSATIFYFLRILNYIGFFSTVCYYVLKLINIYTPNTYKTFMSVALNTINFGYKYIIFFIFAVIIYYYNKNINVYKPEETDKIIYTQVID